MNPKELLKQAKALAEQTQALLVSDTVDMDVVNANTDKVKALRARATALQDMIDVQSELGQAVPVAPLPTETKEEAKATEADNGKNLVKAIHVIRHGEIGDAESLVMREVYGGDYRQINHDQTAAFKHYLRKGEATRPLTRQVWDIDKVKAMLNDHMSVAEVKATMVEGQDILGGYAVPVEIGNAIIKRSMGLTAVRAGGATVVQTASKSIEWLKITGGDDQYPSALRGFWGNESQNPPNETNLTFGLRTIPVHVYTYRVPMSTSLIEDASNITSIFTNMVSDTLGIDEDVAFLVGSGVGRPNGILPTGLNLRNLNEVSSLSAALLTMDGLKGLKRGIASHYRAAGRASMIANGDTGLALELLKDGEDRYFFPDGLNIGDDVMRSVWRESEAMPDVAADAFPLIHADLSGYVIVERLGLAVQRYNDSGTGINTVEFQVRRRLGGDVVEPWKFAVQKVEA